MKRNIYPIVAVITAIFFSCSCSMTANKPTKTENIKIKTSIRVLPEVKNFKASSRVTGGWKFDIKNDIRFLFHPRLNISFGDNINGFSFPVDWDPGNWNESSYASFDKLYLERDIEIFEYRLRLGIGINQFNSEINDFWDLVHSQTNHPFDMTDLGDIYPLGVPAIWADVYLGDIDLTLITLENFNMELNVWQHTFSKMSKYSDNNLRLKNLDREFKLNSELILGWRYKDTDFKFKFFRGYSSTPKNKDDSDNKYEPCAFGLWSIGMDIERYWGKWRLAIRPSYTDSDSGIDDYLQAVIEASRTFTVYGYLLDLKFLHLAAHTLNESNAKNQRLWDPKRGLGNSVSAKVKLHLGKYWPFLNVTNNYEEESIFLQPGMEFLLTDTIKEYIEPMIGKTGIDRVTGKIYGDFFFDGTDSYFDPHENSWGIGFEFTFEF